MAPPTRSLRSQADAVGKNGPDFKFNRRDWERHDAILLTGEILLARHGHMSFSFRAFALAMRLSRCTLERHFIDLHDLLGEILRRHLAKVIDAIAKVPRDTPNRLQAMRHAYLAATRNAEGDFTDAHLLLIRDRAKLPPDILDAVDGAHYGIGVMLSEPGKVTDTLEILDWEGVTPDEIELVLADEDQPAPAKQAPDHPPPATPPIEPAAEPLTVAAEPPPDDDLSRISGVWPTQEIEKPRPQQAPPHKRAA